MAARAGVSVSLASLALSGSPVVGDGSRERILAAARELGYRADAVARGLRSRGFTLGVMLLDLRNPFYADFMDGVYAGAARTPYQALLGTGNHDALREQEVVESMLDRRTDGLILQSPVLSDEAVCELAGEVPTVIAGRRVDCPHLDCVTGDDFAGAGMVVEHLAGLGHERIGHVAGPEVPHRRETPTMAEFERRRGYEDAMSRLGLEGGISVAATSYSEKGGYEGALYLLAQEPRPTAIFAGNDWAALGVMDALADSGLSVPEDVSVVGYDDTYLARSRHLSLTTVSQPGEKEGIIAVELLVERIEGRRLDPANHVFEPELVVRSTTAPPT